MFCRYKFDAVDFCAINFTFCAKENETHLGRVELEVSKKKKKKKKRRKGRASQLFVRVRLLANDGKERAKR